MKRNLKTSQTQITVTCYEKKSYKSGYAGLLVLPLLLLFNPWLIVIVFSIGITFVDVHLNWFNWFHFLILEGGVLLNLIHCMIFLSPFLDVTRIFMSIISTLTQSLEFSNYSTMSSFDLWSKWFYILELTDTFSL